MNPLAIDLFCGLGGWTSGLLATGWDCIGFDIEQHAYDGERYPAQLVIQDVLTLHGSQFRSADLIVASPPCQFFSYVAMPWSRAKALGAEVRADPVKLAEKLALFNACFRIQRECNEARAAMGLPPVPMVVENVRGAQPWVGRARGNYGSYYLFGDVPALMPQTGRGRGIKGPGHGASWVHPSDPRHTPGLDFTRLAGIAADGRKVPGFRFDGSGGSFQTASVEGMKMPEGTRWFNDGPRTPDSLASSGSKSPARKAASAKIARIPLTLSTWIGTVYHPGRAVAA